MLADLNHGSERPNSTCVVLNYVSTAVNMYFLLFIQFLYNNNNTRDAYAIDNII